ncbi:organic solute transporter subunit alpha [Erpetoichthys calabaricus]|uniref:Organic solute transporter subunit alpha-like n=1 Tax=Erpetoichthys calabaricus TaxID=27687 RepID=A0A8C4TGI7_ERPCA|nr:organic solute transporter subunit alpha [Erpetoichthys calabaricus]XP_028669513.1 organic solute transporter subunit alpha [Erpetoichthys calabaricus]
MVRRSNCSVPETEIPLSTEFFEKIKGELWLFLLPALLTFILSAVFLEEMGFLFRNITSCRRRRLYLWILGIYPVFSMTSLIGMYVPRSMSVCSFVASLYHSITLWKFLALITDFFGGKSQMLVVLEGQLVSPNPFPCCCCCCFPMITVNRSNIRWMTAIVFQLSVVRTILFFVTMVLWTDEKYDYGDVDYKNPNAYVNAIIGVSTFLSFYGYLLFYKATRRALHGYGLRAKFICIILILVLCGLQSGILETMAAFGVIPCNPPFSRLMRSQLIYHYSIIVEMFCIGLFARQCFRKVEPGSPNGSTSEFGPVSFKQDKYVQTEEVHLAERISVISQEPWTGMMTSALNHGYHSDSEDSLCKIEHAPLDEFHFTQQPSSGMTFSERIYPHEQRFGDMVSTGKKADLEMGKMMVKAEINYNTRNEVTVV